MNDPHPSTDALLAEIKDERLRRLYQYWNDKRGARRFPARRDIDPLDFAYVLGHVMLIDVTHDPLRFRFRLYGSALLDRNNAVDMTGKYLDEHARPEFRAYLRDEWADTVERGSPTHGFFDRMIDDELRKFEVLRLPLSADGTTVDMLLVCAVFGL
jgi:hypothetical protein